MSQLTFSLILFLLERPEREARQASSPSQPNQTRPVKKTLLINRAKNYCYIVNKKPLRRPAASSERGGVESGRGGDFPSSILHFQV